MPVHDPLPLFGFWLSAFGFRFPALPDATSTVCPLASLTLTAVAVGLARCNTAGAELGTARPAASGSADADAYQA